MNPLMKVSFFLGLACTAGGAFASGDDNYWTQKYCSTADDSLHFAVGSTVKVFYGRTLELVGPERERRKVGFNAPQDLKFKTSARQELVNKRQDNCKPGKQDAVENWQLVTFEKVDITRQDDQEFSESLIGLSRNKRSLTGYWLCEEQGRRTITCD